jgi:hypothetical protein
MTEPISTSSGWQGVIARFARCLPVSDATPVMVRVENFD